MTNPQQDSPIRVGDVLAEKYRVEKILGAGAMGVVVAARHIELGELWAIKFMLPAALGNAEGVERFVREARAAARLRSRHVAKVHDIGRLPNGAPYLVMEHLTGTDLKGLLDQRGPLPPAEGVRYVLQACEALGEAHAAGIVHRDLKPANLFLTTEVNGAPCVKLLDFGIAKVSGGPPGTPGAMEMTGTLALLGTPLYMSPEQMRGARDVDARTDIWALGVILYRMFAGKTPFTGSSVTEICSAVVADTPEPLSRIRSDLPPGLEAVVMRCLEKNPAQRFQSVAELSAALAPFAQGPAAGAGAYPAPASQAAPAVQGPAAAHQTFGPGGGTHGPGGSTHGPAAGGYTHGPGAQSAPQVAAAGGYTHGPGSQSAPQVAAAGGYTYGPGAQSAPAAGGYTYGPGAQSAPAAATPGAPGGFGPASAQAPHPYSQGPAGAPPQAGFATGPAPFQAQGATGPGVAVAHSMSPGIAPPVPVPAPPAKGSKTPLVVGAILAILGIGGIAVAAVVLTSSGSGSEQAGGAAASPQRPIAADPRPTATGTSTAPASPGKAAAPGFAGPKPAAQAPGGQPPSGQPSSGQPSSGQPASSPAASAQPTSAPAAAPGSLAIGAACKAAAECSSGFCVDGVCCDMACTGKCMACTPQKKVSGGGPGICGFVSGGEDPEKECGGADKRCSGMGSCVTLTPAQIKNLTGHD